MTGVPLISRIDVGSSAEEKVNRIQVFVAGCSEEWNLTFLSDKAPIDVGPWEEKTIKLR